jgi:hypothetical protein
LRYLPVVVILLCLGCSGDEEESPTAPDEGTTKVFAIDVTERHPCSEAEAYRVCQDLGFSEAKHYRCKNYDNSGVFIYEVTCWKP